MTKPSASKQKPIEITATAIRVRQAGHEFLSFAMTATEIARLGCPIRFTADPVHGIQRDLDPRQVKGFVDSMKRGRPIPSTVVLNLTGSWIIEGGMIYGIEGSSTIEVLDGQHRGQAAKDLIAQGDRAIADGYEFTVLAVVNATDATRSQLFASQIYALRMSSGHAAAVRAKSGDFGGKGEEEAFQIADVLNTREDSILKGRVHIGDLMRVGPRGRRVIREGTWIALPSLVTALRTITGEGSIIHDRPLEEKLRFTLDLLDAADTAYPTQFSSKDGTLRTAFGLTALCLLSARKDGNFRTMLLERGATKAEMLRLFGMVPRFQWNEQSTEYKRHRTPALVVARFNERLAKAIAESRQ